MRCDPSDLMVTSSLSKFQSLSGFLMRCDRYCCLKKDVLDFKFQSLSGFLMRCDRPLHGGRRSHHPVSIPIGFSDAL